MVGESGFDVEAGGCRVGEGEAEGEERAVLDEVRKSRHRPWVTEVPADRGDGLDPRVVFGAEEVVEVEACAQGAPVRCEGEEEQAGDAEGSAG